MMMVPVLSRIGLPMLLGLIIFPKYEHAFSQTPTTAFLLRSSSYNSQCTARLDMVASASSVPIQISVENSDSSNSNKNGSSISSSAASKNSGSGLRYGNRPIVLVGCSGKGDEISRLAKSLVSGMSTTASVSAGVSTGRVVGPNDAKNLLPTLTNQDVIVVDYADSELSQNKELVSDRNDLMQFLYEDLNCLCIYVNVHPDAGDMAAMPRSIREENEENIFLQYSDYELALRDEGRTTTTTSNTKNKEGDGENNNYVIFDDWSNAEWEMNRIVARANLPRTVPGNDGDGGSNNSCNSAQLSLGGQNTFFLSLSFPDISLVKPYVPSLCKDNDAMEFRADLLDCQNDRHAILHSLFQLRAMTRPHAFRAPALPFYSRVIDDALPIVYTVRTANQAGTYPDATLQDIENMFALLRLGIRGASEVMDVESAWDEQLTSDFLSEVESKYSSLILGSHHVVPNEVTMAEAVSYYRQCALKGRAHGAKVVLSIQDPENDHMALDASRIAARLSENSNHNNNNNNNDRLPVIPAVALVLGEIGQYSRIINTGFTPVTHPALPFTAAPGQLSSEEIMRTRVEDGIVPPKRYAILGHNIAYSVSPQMQGAAFRATGLPHEYGRADHETVEEFVNNGNNDGGLWNRDDFGGLSVTIPHKQSVMPYMDVLSDAAARIGSVNTVTVVEKGPNEEEKGAGRVLYGDNTDWKGIYNPLRRRLGVNDNNEEASGYALILGGGGTARAAAYAAQQLGLKRVYYNRTTKKAQELADTFGGEVVTSLDEGEGSRSSLGSVLKQQQEELSSIKVIISTLPAGAEFELPEWIISSCTSNKNVKPVIFDVNYKPYWTKLLIQSERYGLDVVRGSEMLWEQGVGQFEIWTGRSAPYKVMKEVVLENCLPTKGD